MQAVAKSQKIKKKYFYKSILCHLLHLCCADGSGMFTAVYYGGFRFVFI